METPLDEPSGSPNDGERRPGGTVTEDSRRLDREMENGDQMASRGLVRIRQKYDLVKGKVTCRCLVRRWKFCKQIKNLADNKVSGDLVLSRTLKEVKADMETGGKGRQGL